MVAEVIDVEVVGQPSRPRLSQRIAAEEHRVGFGAVLLDVFGAPFWLLGWLTFWLLVAGGGVVRWCVAAVRLGWLEARQQAMSRGMAATRWPVRPRTAKAAHGSR